MSTITLNVHRFLWAIGILILAACVPAEPLSVASEATTPQSLSPTSTIPAPTNPPLATATPTLIPPVSLPAGSTLGDYLSAYQLPAAGLDTLLLEQKIRIPAVQNNHQAFFMAYYLEASEFPRPLQLLKFEKTTGNWLTAEIHEDEHFRLGDLIGILESDEFYFIEMHTNPSAGWVLLVSKEMTLHDSLNGNVRGLYSNGMAVYSESQVHFAPTHYVLIDVYDPTTQESHRIFPQEPYQPLWRQHMEAVGHAYQELGETWCQENNHHCDPERFNNWLASEVAVNEETDSLAFTIAFTGGPPPNFPAETRVVYLFRGVNSPAQLTYREVSEDQLKQLFGDYEMAELLEAENLDQIFTHFAYSE